MTIEQEIREYLSQRTTEGTFQPGSKLPTERQMVEQFAAPRSAVRRALESLERDGVVIRHVGRGTFLTEAAVAASGGAPADTSPAEIMQARMVLEPQVSAVAAREATRADLDRIGQYLEAGGRSHDFEGFESWDGKLHRAIAEAAHNGLILNMYDVLNAGRALPIWGTRKRRAFSLERRSCYHDEHVAIVDALRDRDPDSAQSAMRTHLIHVSDNLLGPS
ncbi:FadR/GntR family transcriptional regulator [Gordonia sp. CPCC 205515]|uniref:FadR/GntR family transcriptional regulator n=1 Tax=Gordonia sp. CPCC 205515 TaxID=3140791 RepID=UPI003AF3AD32